MFELLRVWVAVIVHFTRRITGDPAKSYTKIEFDRRRKPVMMLIRFCADFV